MIKNRLSSDRKETVNLKDKHWLRHLVFSTFFQCSSYHLIKVVSTSLLSVQKLCNDSKRLMISF